MMRPPYFQEVFGWRVGMNGVVNKQVERVAKREARQNTKGVAAENKAKNEEQQRGYKNRDNGRHGQARLVFGVLVVHTMHSVLKLGPPRRGSRNVVEVAVHGIFHKREHKPAHQEQTKGRHAIDKAPGDAVIQAYHGRKQENRNRQRNMGVRKALQYGVFEQLCRTLVLGLDLVRCFYRRRSRFGNSRGRSRIHRDNQLLERQKYVASHKHCAEHAGTSNLAAGLVVGQQVLHCCYGARSTSAVQGRTAVKLLAHG